MDISIAIAQVLGIFFVLVGLSMVAQSKATAAAIEASVENKGTLWLWGFIALLVGAVIIVLNNAWASGLQLLVTVIGWIALLKGIFILFFPGAAVSLYRKFNMSGMLVFCGVVAFVLGLVLIYW